MRPGHYIGDKRTDIAVVRLSITETAAPAHLVPPHAVMGPL